MWPNGMQGPNHNMKDDVFNGTGDQPPLPSRAMRRIAKRSKYSSRGGIVVQIPGWARPRVVFFESKLEQRVLFLLLARGDLIDLWEQPPLITYRDEEGRRRTHFCDFLIRLSSGRRIAIAVKPATRHECERGWRGSTAPEIDSMAYNTDRLSKKAVVPIF